MSHIPKPKKDSPLTMSGITKESSKKTLQKMTMESVNVPKLAQALKKTPAQGASTGTVKRPLQASNKPATAPAAHKKPMKRLAAPTSTETKPKVLKPNPPKPAPYDYKARFNLLKEQHDNLKSAFTKNKEMLVQISNENEELLGSNEKLVVELKNCTDELLVLRPRSSELEIENKFLKQQLEDYKKKLISSEERLTTTISENKEIKVILEENIIEVDTLTKTNEKLMELVQKNTLQIEDLKEEVIKLDNNRRILHNEIQEMKGNIRVFCRIRPSLPEENCRFLCNINYMDENSLEISKGKETMEPTGRLTTNRIEFTFDKVFSPFVSQEEVFFELAQLVRSVLDGYNVCVFAYGQTGSGKTYTMDGANTEDSLGMIPRAIDLIFTTLEEMQKLDWTFTVKASFLEIYNEVIIDLLSTKKHQHEIRMTDSKAKDVYVTNLTVETVSSAEELKSFMRIAQSKRSVAATENNERSSRSHSVTKICIECVRSQKNEKYYGSLNLIDLAGSERMTSTSSSRVKETQNINKSLANLSNVILALVQNQEHVPYRNSKLTHLLMPCLGGNSKTLMLVNIAPFEDCYNESINSLRFASIVNQCKTGIVKKNKTLNT